MLESASKNRMMEGKLVRPFNFKGFERQPYGAMCLANPETDPMPLPNDVVAVPRNAAIEFVLSGLKSYGRKTGERAESLYLFARPDVERYQAQREREFELEGVES